MRGKMKLKFLLILFSMISTMFLVTNCQKESPGNATEKVYNLRDTGPGGGLVFYDKGIYSNGWRYLEAAPKSTEWIEKEWGKKGTDVTGTQTEIGTGRQNTNRIVNKLTEDPIDINYMDRAATLCYNLKYGGYNDWFLPSRDELSLMNTNLIRHGVGSFGDFGYGRYWSSSGSGSDYAWDQDISCECSPSLGFKSGDGSKKFVRAIRAF